MPSFSIEYSLLLEAGLEHLQHVLMCDSIVVLFRRNCWARFQLSLLIFFFIVPAFTACQLAQVCDMARTFCLLKLESASFRFLLEL